MVCVLALSWQKGTKKGAVQSPRALLSLPQLLVLHHPRRWCQGCGTGASLPGHCLSHQSWPSLPSPRLMVPPTLWNTLSHMH